MILACCEFGGLCNSGLGKGFPLRRGLVSCQAAGLADICLSVHTGEASSVVQHLFSITHSNLDRMPLFDLRWRVCGWLPALARFSVATGAPLTTSLIVYTVGVARGVGWFQLYTAPAGHGL